MKKIIFTAMAALSFISLSAKAQLTETTVQQYTNAYIAAFEGCDVSKVNAFLDSYYADNYTMTLQAPNGQTREATREQVAAIAAQGLKIMRQVNGEKADCRPDIALDKSQLNGNTGVIQTTQKEEITFPQNGKMVGVRANTTCEHQIIDKSGTLQVQKSQCVLYQTK